MGEPLPRRETGPRGGALTTPNEDRAAAEQRRAALGYLLWPAALYEHFVEREPASSWYRIQVRRALAFGILSSIIGTAALIWPLALSLLIGNVTATLVLYGLAIVLDCVLFALWLRRAVRYSKAAARGETFEIQHLLPIPTRRVSANR